MNRPTPSNLNEYSPATAALGKPRWPLRAIGLAVTTILSATIAGVILGACDDESTTAVTNTGTSTGNGTGTATGTDTDAGGQGGSSSGGPAYAQDNAACPALDGGTKTLKLVNNCTETRWFKLDGKTTPTWARPTDCPWVNETCTDVGDIVQCTPKALQKAQEIDPNANPGKVYCIDNKCACNPFFEIASGQAEEIAFPSNDTAYPSATGWLATGCNAYGAQCTVGNEAAKNGTFEFTYDPPGGTLWYDISAVNSWTTASAIGMKSCGGSTNPSDVFWCNGAGCRFDVDTQCPDGTDKFAAAPAGCSVCAVTMDAGKQVLDGPCGTCPYGDGGNQIPSGTTFNHNDPVNEWTWQGSQDFALGWGYNEGTRVNRRANCDQNGSCTMVTTGQANSCLGGCDLCTHKNSVGTTDPTCLKYCCPDIHQDAGGFDYRYDSAGCTAIGVQAGTDYTVAVKSACPYVYTYGYEDHSSTFKCENTASLLVMACADAANFPSSL